MGLEVRGTPSASLVEVLRASEERFRALLDSAPDAAVIVDGFGCITLINEQTERLFGFPREELIGRSVEVLLPDQLQAIHVAHRNGYLADPKTRSMGAGLELAGRRKDGTEFPIDISLSAITTDGSLLAMAYIRDITERKGAERSLIRQAAWVELAHDPIFSWVFGGEITHWNAEAEQTYGFAREEAMGQLPHDLLCTEFAEPLEAIQAQLLRDGQWESELVQRRRDGSPIVVQTRWVLNLGRDGIPIGVMEVNRDITSRKLAESEAARQTLVLEQTIAQLANSNQELEQFAYIASHDLSEPLRSISSPIALVAHRYRGQLDPDTDRFIDFAVEGCQRMQTIIDDLLAFSRAGRGAALEWVDTNLLVNTVMADLSARLGETGARLHVGDLPTVLAQPVHLGQVFQNLIANALKFVAPGVVPDVSVSAVQVGNEWRFGVTDNGIGIKPQYQEQIFGMFKRLHSRDDYSGTGIGLALCKRIVERHGGRIGVENAPGASGCCFWFTVPNSPKGN